MKRIRRFLTRLFAPKMTVTIKWTLDDGNVRRCEYRLTDQELRQMADHIPKSGTFIAERLIVNHSITIQR
jgi:hypothetical protein